MINWLFHILFSLLKPSFLFPFSTGRSEVRVSLRAVNPELEGSECCSKLYFSGWVLANAGLNPSSLLERWSLQPLGLPAIPDVRNAASLATNKSRSCVTAAVMVPKQTHSPSNDRQDLTKSLWKLWQHYQPYGVRVLQVAWETIRVRHQLQSDFWLSFGISSS